MEQPSFDMTPFSDFESASHAVLEFLHSRIGMALWMVTRTEGDEWIVLQADDHGYGIEKGTVLKWSESYCYRMVQDEGRGSRRTLARYSPTLKPLSTSRLK